MTSKYFIVCFLICVVGTTANPDVNQEMRDIAKKISEGFQQAEAEIAREFHRVEHAIEEDPDIFDDVKQEFEGIGRKISDGFQVAETAVVDEYSKVEHAVEEEFRVIETAILNACACTRYSCGCCAHLEEAQIELNATICTNITYLAHDYGISFTVTVNNFAIFNETVSARNPPPVCLGIPYVKELADVCVRLYDINATASYLHACVSIEARMKMILIAKYDLGCFNIGPPGITSAGINAVDKLDDINRVVENTQRAVATESAPYIVPMMIDTYIEDSPIDAYTEDYTTSDVIFKDQQLFIQQRAKEAESSNMEAESSNASSGLVIPIVASLGAIIFIGAITLVVYFAIKKKRDERRAMLQFMKRYGSTNSLVPQVDPYC